jgi:hypothetical protein
LYAPQFLRNCGAAKSRSVSPALAAADAQDVDFKKFGETLPRKI